MKLPRPPRRHRFRIEKHSTPGWRYYDSRTWRKQPCAFILDYDSDKRGRITMKWIGTSIGAPKSKFFSYCHFSAMSRKRVRGTWNYWPMGFGENP